MFRFSCHIYSSYFVVDVKKSAILSRNLQPYIFLFTPENSWFLGFHIFVVLHVQLGKWSKRHGGGLPTSVVTVMLGKCIKRGNL